jgi:hypothetical protein
MGAIIDFKEGPPEANGQLLAVYSQIIGPDQVSVVDVFIDNMKQVKYTLSTDIIAAQDDKQLVVAVLRKADAYNVLVGLSIRKPGDSESTEPQVKKTFWDFLFKSAPANP